MQGFGFTGSLKGSGLTVGFWVVMVLEGVQGLGLGVVVVLEGCLAGLNFKGFRM